MSVPTNAWFTAFLTESGKRPVHTVPYLLVAADNGLDVCYPQLDTASFPYAVIAPMTANLSLRSVTALSAPKVTAFTDLGCTLTWTGGATSDVVRGAAYVTMRYAAVRPVVTTVHAITAINGVAVDATSTNIFAGTKFRLTLNNGQVWIIYTSANVSFAISGGQTLTAVNALTGTVRVAYLPTGGEAALDAGAPAIHTGGSVAMSVSSDLYTKTLTYTFTGVGAPLTYAMPHHQDVLSAPNYAALTLAGTMRGTLRGVVGAIWSLAMPFTMPGWNNANPVRADRVQAVRDSLAVDRSYIPTAFPYGINDTIADPYFGAKWQAKAGRLALIADQLGDTAARNQLVGNMRTVFTRYLTGGDPNTRLRYDPSWGGIVSEKGLTDSGVDFGNGRYNDHYFHYGYMIYAAAVLAKFDPAWAVTHQQKIDDLIRDIANPSGTDPYFPRLRHFDEFEGHSWASGTQEGAQANQESTSEAVNAWYGIYLWGLATNRPQIAQLGTALFTEEVRTAQKYWQIRKSSTIYPENIRAYGCIGILWSFKYEVGTWFSSMTAQLEHVHGIQMLPITPASEVLLPDAWLQETWTTNLLPLLNRNPPPTSPWWTLLVAAHGQTDPDDAWALLSGVPADRESWDDGFSKTQALYHIATQEAAVPAPARSVPLIGSSQMAWNSLLFSTGGSAAIAPFETWRGRATDGRMYFPARSTWAEMKQLPTRPRQDLMVFAIPPYPTGIGGSNAAVAAGTYDANIQDWAAALVTAGWNHNRTVIRLGWENNLTSYPWSWSSTTYQTFINAFRRFVQQSRAAGLTGVKWDWCLNKGPQGANSSVNWTIAYPGDDVVDIIGIDPYDMYTPSFTDAQWNANISGKNPGLQDVAVFARAHGKQMSIDEWGVTMPTPMTSDFGGDNPFYIAKLFAFCKANADILAWEVTYEDSGQYNQKLSDGSKPLAAAEYLKVYPNGWGG